MVHESAMAASASMLAHLRRINHVNPVHYLELVRTYRCFACKAATRCPARILLNSTSPLRTGSIVVLVMGKGPIGKGQGLWKYQHDPARPV